MHRESGRSLLHHLSVILAAAGMMLCLFGIVTVGSVDANEKGHHEPWNRNSSQFEASGALRAASVPPAATRLSGTTIAAISSRKSPECTITAGDVLTASGPVFSCGRRSASTRSFGPRPSIRSTSAVTVVLQRAPRSWWSADRRLPAIVS